MQIITRTSSRSKRITLRAEPPDRVIVSSPRFTPKIIINRFIKQQTPWIEKQLAKLQQKQQQLESGQHVTIFGKKYQKRVLFDKTLPSGISIQQDTILFNFPQGKSSSTSLQKKELELFLKKNAKTYLKKRTKELAVLMDVSYNRITLRNQKTRWGSCSSQDSLSLNWRLVHYPPEVIDYVIIHELAHLVHHNHSKQFWQLVEKYDPQYKQHRSYLKKHASVYN